MPTLSVRFEQTPIIPSFSQSTTVDRLALELRENIAFGSVTIDCIATLIQIISKIIQRYAVEKTPATDPFPVLF